jgi:hypothetical protein
MILAKRFPILLSALLVFAGRATAQKVVADPALAADADHAEVVVAAAVAVAVERVVEAPVRAAKARTSSLASRRSRRRSAESGNCRATP